MWQGLRRPDAYLHPAFVLWVWASQERDSGGLSSWHLERAIAASWLVRSSPCGGGAAAALIKLRNLPRVELEWHDSAEPLCHVTDS